MRSLLYRVVCIAVLLAGASSFARAAERFKLELRDGDRVAFVGSALLEREQVGGYIETMLVTRFPDRNITFRNLAYSGDTVNGDARGLCTGWSTFETAEQGLGRLRKIVQEVRPTVLILNYGMNESFNGSAQIPQFIAAYDRLLDMLTKAAKGADGTGHGVRQVIFLSPNFHEDLGRPMPDPAAHDRDLQAYTHAIGQLATKRGDAFIDLFAITEEAAKSGVSLTSDGIHFTPYGYWWTALALERAMGLAGQPWRATLDATALKTEATGNQLSDLAATPEGGLRFRMADTHLPPPPAPTNGAPTARRVVPEADRMLTVSGLKPGTYMLKADDQPIARATADQWAAGVQLDAGPEVQRVESLRQLVIAKNFDFFNYWRPENDSYILSFRRHEQGKNAVELPEFKPVAKSKEDEIAKLRVPEPVTYTLARDDRGK